MKQLIFIILLLPSLALADDTLATTALLVEEPVDAALAQKLEPLIAHSDSRIRAAAARVANVRSLTALLPPLKTALTNENVAEAAREQVRAIGQLGTREDIDMLLNEIQRFDKRLDGALASAIARRGSIHAMEVYDSHVRRLASLGDIANFFTLAFWGSPRLVPATAARLLGRRDERGWHELLRAIEQSDMLPPITVAVAAFSMDDAFRTLTAWHLVRALACEGELPGCRSDFTKLERDVLMSELNEEPPVDSPHAFRFARELLRRIFGIESEPRTTPEFLQWLATNDADAYLDPNSPLLAKYLTRAERSALAKGKKLRSLPKSRKSALAPIEISPRRLQLLTPLPKDVATSILSATNCEDAWIGVVHASVDKNGHVSTLNLSSVDTTSECKRALTALARLSLPINRSMNTPHFDIGDLLVVRGPKARLCLDESNVSEFHERIRAERYRTNQLGTGEIKPPKVIRRVDPTFPTSALSTIREKGGASLVMVEAMITREGCVREVDLVQQSPLGELNRAALIAVSQWTFEPGTLEGIPVDVTFNLTINFKSN